MIPLDALDPPSLETWRALLRKGVDELRTTHEGALVSEPLAYPGLPGHDVETSLRAEGGWQIWASINSEDSRPFEERLEILASLDVEGLWFNQGLPPSWIQQLAHKPRLALGLASPGFDAPEVFDFLERYEGFGGPIATLRGCVGVDPSAGLFLHGEQPQDVWQDTAAIHHRYGERCPHLKTLALDAGVYYEAGATDLQELVFLLSASAEALRHLEGYGISPESFFERTLFSLKAGRNYPLQVAKFRAARELLTRMAVACGVKQPDVEIHARTSLRTHSLVDPWNNALRSTVEAFAAILGGVDHLTVMPWDRILEGGEALGERLAVTTQWVLREEASLHEVADAAGGSWYFENLGAQFCRRAWNGFCDIERSGGWWEALRSGRSQALMHQSVEDRRRRTLAGERPVVGLTHFPKAEEDLERTERILGEIGNSNEKDVAPLRREAEAAEKRRVEEGS